MVVVPTPEQQRATWSNPATPPPTNHATNSPGYVEDAAADWLTVLSRSFQTWGRKIDAIVFNPTGPTEEAQRADALAVAAMNPFAVLVSNQTTGAGTVFTAEIAAKKIVIFTANGTNADAAQQAPYRWQGVFDNDASAVNGAQFIGQMLVGETAKWAGDPSMRTKTRVFGAIYPERNLNFDLFLEGFAKYKGAKLAEKVQYSVPLDAAQVQPQNQIEAPTADGQAQGRGCHERDHVRVGQHGQPGDEGRHRARLLPRVGPSRSRRPRPREHRAVLRPDPDGARVRHRHAARERGRHHRPVDELLRVVLGPEQGHVPAGRALVPPDVPDRRDARRPEAHAAELPAGALRAARHPVAPRATRPRAT